VGSLIDRLLGRGKKDQVAQAYREADAQWADVAPVTAGAGDPGDELRPGETAEAYIERLRVKYPEGIV